MAFKKMPNKSKREESISETERILTILAQRIDSLDKIKEEFEERTRGMEKHENYLAHKDGVEIQDIKKDVADTKKEIRHITIYIHHMIEELKSTVKSEEIDKIRKRIDQWGPDNFITTKEAERIIRREIFK